MKNFKNKKGKTTQKGFAAFFLTILIMVIIFGSAVSIFVLTYIEQQITQNIVKSTQSYYAAEAGTEDILLRLIKDMEWSSPYTLNVGEGETTVNVSDVFGGSRTIVSEGNVSNKIRKTEIVYEISSDNISFYYGAQIGEGGLLMDNGSFVEGNIFSNGDITAESATEITGSVKVSQVGNYIDGVTIGENAFVDICNNSDITGTLTCTDPGNCTASSVEMLSEEITPLPLPIPSTQIDEWKTDAESGGTYSGDYILTGQSEASLGLIKIEGKMIIQDQAKLDVTGTIWVTGEIVIQNRGRVRLDNDSFGSLGGVIISDDKITLKDKAKALGSGQEGSYLMLLSTFDGDAILIQDDFETDILYTQNGWVIIQDTTGLRSVTGYGVHLKNNAGVIYEVGMEDISFSSGPGGDWQVTSWQEVE